MNECLGLCDIAVDVFWKAKGIKGFYLTLRFCLLKLYEAHSHFTSDKQVDLTFSRNGDEQLSFHLNLHFLSHVRENVSFYSMLRMLCYYYYMTTCFNVIVNVLNIEYRICVNTTVGLNAAILRMAIIRRWNGGCKNLLLK